MITKRQMKQLLILGEMLEKKRKKMEEQLAREGITIESIMKKSHSKKI